MNVLVLNQDYSHFTICTVNRSFLLLYNCKADLIAQSKNRLLRSINKSFPYPSVIKLNRYINIPHKSVTLSRTNIFKRDQFLCQYCGKSNDLTLDHVIPRSRGGKSIWTNLVTACRSCNAKKGDHLIGEINMKLNKNPVKPSFVMYLKNLNHRNQDDWLPFLEPKAYN